MNIKRVLSRKQVLATLLRWLMATTGIKYRDIISIKYLTTKDVPSCVWHLDMRNQGIIGNVAWLSSNTHALSSYLLFFSKGSWSVCRYPFCDMCSIIINASISTACSKLVSLDSRISSSCLRGYKQCHFSLQYASDSFSFYGFMEFSDSQSNFMCDSRHCLPIYFFSHIPLTSFFLASAYAVETLYTKDGGLMNKVKSGRFWGTITLFMGLKTV